MADIYTPTAAASIALYADCDVALSESQRLTDEEFQSLLDEYYALERTIRELNMSFHLGERRHRLIPCATQEALRERSARLDDLLAQEKALRDRLIQAAD